MQSNLTLIVLRLFEWEREARLRRTHLLVSEHSRTRRVRRWIGRRLVRIGAWLAGDPTFKPVRAR